jgi:thiosulfate reductase/polysulfide reductase chain A
MTEEQGLEVKKSMCFFCKPRCIQTVYVKDGRLVKVDPSPIKGCPRWRVTGEWFYHPDRLKFPRKRVGEKGQNKWERVSWDQALDEIAAKLQETKEQYGAEGVAVTAGTSRTYEELNSRFLNLFGSPNQVGQAQICHGNSAVVATMVYGWWPYWMSTEKLENTQCILMLGRDPRPSHQTIWEGLLEAQKRGAKLIAVDPRRSSVAARADLWLQLRPGTDCALLMSMINVIIEEDLYDKEFVTQWCHGFEELRERAGEYPPEKAEEITWVPADQIRAAARMFATHRPSCAIEGMGVAHQPNALGALQARHIISAIVGNIDVAGGEELLGPAPFITEHEIELPEALPEEQRDKILGADRYRLYTWPGYDLIQRQNVERVWGKRCDMYGYTCMATGPALFRAIAYSQPYPVKALITLSSNPMVTMPNVKLVYKALKNLDLYVVVDYFMTPSAELADYVLPAACWLERDFLFNYHNTTPVMTAGEAALPSVVPGEYDRRTDFEFWRELGIRLGQEEYWPWETAEEYYDYRLKPMGLTFKELVQMGRWAPERKYKKYEEMGFGTPTGKIELYSTVLEQLGYDPLPRYKEPPESPISTPELSEEYPFILITGARFLPFFHSEFRQVETLRKMHPHPLCEIHPQTAKELGIEEGDWVWIESPRGRIMQKCKYFEGIDPRVVHAQHGWWYPEMPGEEPWLHGVWISNVNVLTDDDLDHCDEALGSWPLKTLQCRVYKAGRYEAAPPLPL